jgi:phospholipid/cholesterol/gamma-HCH transport system substrate-binding protein
VRRSVAKFWGLARSEPGLGRNLLAIGALVALGSVFAAYFLSHQRFNPPWEDRYTVNALFEEAAAISPGNGQEVRIAGVPVGDIRNAEVTEDGRARLELRIDSEHELHKDATVVLRPKSPLNDMYVEIDPGSPGAPTLEDGDTLPVSQSVSPVQVDEVLAHLDDNAQAALSTLLSESDIALARAPQAVPPGLEASRELLAELEPVVTQLEQRREHLARLVNALADVSAAAGTNDVRLQRLATSLSSTLETVSGRRESLDRTLAQLPALSTELHATSSSVTQLAGQLDPTLANVHRASDELPGALARFRESVDELDTFVDRAEPVVDRAGPVVADLRATTPYLRRVAGDLRPVTGDLRPMTATAVPYLDDVAAFVYNTNSVASLRDANRGVLRGLFAISPESVPLDLRTATGGDRP